VLEEGADVQTTRLGFLHVIHTSCLVSHIRLEEGLEKKGILYLLAAFRLETGIVLDKNELVEYAVAISTCREAPKLCHSLDFRDEICEDSNSG
jgi:hypothetical protein